MTLADTLMLAAYLCILVILARCGWRRSAGGRLGVADVREFGLTWEDCEGFLSRLGYRTTVAPGTRIITYANLVEQFLRPVNEEDGHRRGY